MISWNPSSPTSLALISVSFHEFLEPRAHLLMDHGIVRVRSTKEPTGQAFFNFTDVKAATAAYRALQEAGHEKRFLINYAQPRS